MSLCALNMPSPDLLTPSKVAATIWSWAPGHPMNPYAAQSWLHSAVLRLQAAVRGAWRGQETSVSGVAHGVQVRNTLDVLLNSGPGTLCLLPSGSFEAALPLGVCDAQLDEWHATADTLVPCCAAPVHCHQCR